MNICSLVVHTLPERASALAGRLVELPGVEVHGGQAEGKLVVTVEDTDHTLAADTLTEINALAGVISSTLIYHYGGDDLDVDHSGVSHSKD